MVKGVAKVSVDAVYGKKCSITPGVAQNLTSALKHADGCSDIACTAIVGNGFAGMTAKFILTLQKALISDG